jgi:hypothetical protein
MLPNKAMPAMAITSSRRKVGRDSREIQITDKLHPAIVPGERPLRFSQGYSEHVLPPGFRRSSLPVGQHRLLGGDAHRVAQGGSNFYF